MDDDICEATGETCPVNGLMNELTRLEQQIEKMKCCDNCKHRYYNDYISELDCDLDNECKNYTKWELRTE